MASAYSSSDVPGEPALRTNVARKVGITQTKTANAKNICGRASRSARSWPCRSVNWRWNRASYRSNRPMPLSLAPGAGAHSVKEAGIASHRPDVASGAAKIDMYGNVYGMERTTVYLTEAQKRALERAARLSGRSEAELIREGVEIVTGRHQIAEPVLPLFESGQPDLAERVDEALDGFGER